jgi:hypothetical protein
MRTLAIAICLLLSACASTENWDHDRRYVLENPEICRDVGVDPDRHSDFYANAPWKGIEKVWNIEEACGEDWAFGCVNPITGEAYIYMTADRRTYLHDVCHMAGFNTHTYDDWELTLWAAKNSVLKPPVRERDPRCDGACRLRWSEWRDRVEMVEAEIERRRAEELY